MAAYTMMGKVGEGSFGTVHLCRCKVGPPDAHLLHLLLPLPNSHLIPIVSIQFHCSRRRTTSCTS